MNCNGAASSPARVVVMSDHVLTRKALVALLTCMDGVEVLADVDSDENVVESVGAARPDAVVLDVDPANTDGIATCGRLVGSHPRIGIVVLARVVGAELHRRAFEAGARGLVGTSSEPAQLREAIRAVRAGHCFVDPALGCDGARGLSNRELEVLTLFSQGLSGRAVARDLEIDYETVRTHVKRARDKFGTKSRDETVAEAVRRGLV